MICVMGEGEDTTFVRPSSACLLLYLFQNLSNNSFFTDHVAIRLQGRKANEK